MNTHNNLIIIKGRISTSQVSHIEYKYDEEKHSRVCDVNYGDERVYTYSEENVIWLSKPKQMPLSPKFKEFYKEVLIFENGDKKYYHVFLNDESNSEYDASEDYPVLNYLREAATVPSLSGNDPDTDADESPAKLLPLQYSKLSQVNSNSALCSYLTGHINNKTQKLDHVLFPFGCNQSQIKAVKEALSNQISIIQGPPGTGKTQTILNIIANLLVQNKSILVVSNNNTAIENVAEKLGKYELQFVTAKLGKRANKTNFLNSQTNAYPSCLFEWKNIPPTFSCLSSDYLNKLEKSFESTEILQKKQKELDELITEKIHFDHLYESKFNRQIQTQKKLSAVRVSYLWQKTQETIDTHPDKKDKHLSFFKKFSFSTQLGIRMSEIKVTNEELILILQNLFYQAKHNELNREIESLKTYLAQNNSEETMKDLSIYSMNRLKCSLYKHYEELFKERQKNNKEKIGFERAIYDIDTLLKNSDDFIAEYPVTLSTTFSSKNNISNETLYDYVIMDEASQVDIATGALALSSAKNAVIVGDSMQLPNVVTGDDKKKLQRIFDIHDKKIGTAYNSAENSFLDSIIKVLPDVPQTLLREHYRCHPKIIEFCNQKFYKGQLIAMTKDNGEDNVLNVVKTVKGNHCREDHINLRQIDCLSKEVLPELKDKINEVGIICPYKNQVYEVRKKISELADSTATVHKFQGREKDIMVFMTTDDEVTSFSDDSNLLNVAISRAKNQLFLITSENEQPEGSNIKNLIAYIEYKNGKVSTSSVRSVFDYLYKQYRTSRLEYLKNKKKVSEYDSENLMYSVIDEVLNYDNFKEYEVLCHHPLNQLITDYSLISDLNELKYAKHPSTHLDFLIFNRVTKQPFLAIEVDGYSFHKKGSKQAARDKKKDNILELYKIPLLRISTRESQIREKLEAKMNELLKQ